MSELILIGVLVQASTPYVLAFAAKANDGMEPLERNKAFQATYPSYDTVYKQVNMAGSRLKNFATVDQFAAFNFEEIKVRHLFVDGTWYVKIENQKPVAACGTP